MVQLVNEWLASLCGRLQAQGAQFGQHVMEGGIQTVQGDEVEVPQRALGRKQLCPASTGEQVSLQTDHGDLCVVCYANKKDWMVRPCNHVCLCFKCANENIHHLHGHCPMCRGMISRVEKVYFQSYHIACLNCLRALHFVSGTLQHQLHIVSRYTSLSRQVKTGRENSAIGGQCHSAFFSGYFGHNTLGYLSTWGILHLYILSPGG